MVMRGVTAALTVCIGSLLLGRTFGMCRCSLRRGMTVAIGLSFLAEVVIRGRILNLATAGLHNLIFSSKFHRDGIGESMSVRSVEGSKQHEHRDDTHKTSCAGLRCRSQGGDGVWK